MLKAMFLKVLVDLISKYVTKHNVFKKASHMNAEMFLDYVFIKNQLLKL